MIRVFWAVTLGGLVGLEREMRNQVAGIRTYSLVSLGSALIMIINILLYLQYDNLDITRLGAQVISGIGFLGAGSTMITKSNYVKVLTTAADLWGSAAVGLSVGAGYYFIAIAGTIAFTLY